MNRIAIRFAAAALLGTAFAAPAFAQDSYEAIVVGTGENHSIEYVRGRPAGQSGYTSMVVGTGENLSVVHTGTPTGHFGHSGIPMVEGTGENLSVVYVPQAAPAASVFAKTGAPRG